MPARLYIQGIDFTDVTDGLDDLQITYDQGESLLMSISVSNELQLTGAGHKYLHSVFFANPCTGKFARLAATIVFDCCDNGDELSFLIDYEGIESSDLDCVTKINLKSLEVLQKCHEYLRDKPYFFGGFSTAFDVPKIRYMIQRKNFWLLVRLFQLLWPFLFLVELIEQALRGVINVVSIILRSPILNFAGITLGQNIANFLDANRVNLPSLDDYLAYMTGSGNYHFAPYIKDIFDHSLAKASEYGGCSLVLDCEDLNLQPYSELALFQAMSKGYKINSVRRFNFNAVYNRTFTQLLEELAEVFRWKTGITPSGQVIIASENRFHQKAPFIFNAEKAFIDGDAEEAPSYKFVTNKLYNISSLSYTEDKIDLESRFKMNPEYSDDIIHGNFTGGERLVKKFVFGPARFMFDSETKSVDTWYDDDLIRDELRSGLSLTSYLPQFIFNWDNVGHLPRDSDLIMSEHTCELPKLLCLVPGTDIEDAKVLKERITNSNAKYFRYNSPMHLAGDEGYLDLYKRFHYVDSPLSLEDRIVEMNDFTISLTSQIVNLIRTNGLFVGVQCKYGQAIPEQIVINISNCTATFKGLKYTCFT